MSITRCNIEGVMDALFREFLSQPGERQYCSELLRSIAKGEKVETKDFLKIPNGATTRGSPKGSPLGSPRNLTLLSPIFLPPSPRSPTAIVPPPSPLSHTDIPHPVPTNLSARVQDCNISPVSSRQSGPKIRLKSNSNLVDLMPNDKNSNNSKSLQNGVEISSNLKTSPKGSGNLKSSSHSSLDSNSNPVDFVMSKQSIRSISKGQTFSFVFNEAMGLSRFSHYQTPVSSKKPMKKWIIIEYQRGASFLTDRLKMSIEVRNAFIWDFTQFLLEYIAKLKEMEIRDKKYYHKTILSIYQLVIVLADFCKKYSGYFRLRVPCTQASVAEYLFDIYRITKLTDVRDTAELWYQKCLSTLKRIEEKPVTELLKLILDVGNFYETLLKDMSPKVSLQERNKYYDQILEVLFQSKAALHKLRSKNWKYQRVTSYTVFTSTSATNILLLALHGKLRNTFEMRLFRRINENLNDITIKEYDQLLLLIRNYKNELLLDNLNDVLEMAENYFFSYRVKNIFLICRV